MQAQAIALLQGSLAGSREAATALEAAEPTPGFVSALLDIACTPSMDKHLRQLAIISVKNTVNRHWSVSASRKASAAASAAGGISPQERASVKARLLEAALLEPLDVIGEQMVTAMAKIAASNGMAEWPELYPALMERLAQAVAGMAPGGDVAAPPSSAAAAAARVTLLRVLQVLHATTKELAAKKLASSKRLFAQLCAQLLPYIAGAWDGLVPPALAQSSARLEKLLHANGAPDVHDALRPQLAGIEWLCTCCVLLCKVATRLLCSLPHRAIVTLPATGKLLSDIGRTIEGVMATRRVAQAIVGDATAARLEKALALPRADVRADSDDEDDDDDDEEEAAAGSIGQLPTTGSLHKLMVKCCKATVRVAEAHPLALAATGATQAFACVYAGWAGVRVATDPATGGVAVTSMAAPEIGGTSVLDPHVSEAVMVHALKFLAQLTDLAGALTAAGSSTTLDAALAGSEKADDAAMLSAAGLPPPDAAADHRKAGADAVVTLHRALFAPGPLLDAWVGWVLNARVFSSLTDRELGLRAWARGSEAWFNSGEVERAYGSISAASSSLLLALITDDRVAAELGGKLVSHARALEAKLLRLLVTSSFGPEVPSVDPRLLLQVEAAWHALGVCNGDNLFRGVMNTDVFSEWYTSTLGPLLVAAGLAADGQPWNVAVGAGVPARAGAIGDVQPGALLVLAPNKEIGTFLAQAGLWILQCHWAVMSRQIQALCFHAAVGAMSGAILLGPASAGAWIRRTACPLPSPVPVGLRLRATALASALLTNLQPLHPMFTVGFVSDFAATVYATVRACRDVESCLPVLSALVSLIQKAEAKVVVQSSGALLGPLPALWAAAGDNNMAKMNILTIVTAVVEMVPLCSGFVLPGDGSGGGSTPPPGAITQDSIRALFAGVVPLVQASCNVADPASVYLAREGIQLWLAVLEGAPVWDTLGPLFMSLLPLLPPITRSDVFSEYSKELAKIATQYAIRGGPAALAAEVPLGAPGVSASGAAILAAAVQGLFINAREAAMPYVLRLVDMMLLSFPGPAGVGLLCAPLAPALSPPPAAAPPAPDVSLHALGVLPCILLGAIKGKVMEAHFKEREERLAEASRKALMERLRGGVGLGPAAGGAGSAPPSEEAPEPAEEPFPLTGVPGLQDTAVSRLAVAVLARAFLNAGPSFLSGCVGAVARPAAGLHGCLVYAGLGPAALLTTLAPLVPPSTPGAAAAAACASALAAVLPPAVLEGLWSLRLSLWCLDACLDALEDVALSAEPSTGTASSSSSSTSGAVSPTLREGASSPLAGGSSLPGSAPTFIAILRNKLLTLALLAILASSTEMSAHMAQALEAVVASAASAPPPAGFQAAPGVHASLLRLLGDWVSFQAEGGDANALNARKGRVFAVVSQACDMAKTVARIAAMNDPVHRLIAVGPPKKKVCGHGGEAAGATPVVGHGGHESSFDRMRRLAAAGHRDGLNDPEPEDEDEGDATAAEWYHAVTGEVGLQMSKMLLSSPEVSISDLGGPMAAAFGAIRAALPPPVFAALVAPSLPPGLV